MVASVKLRDDYKRRLDRLREDLCRIRNDTVTAQEVLEHLIDIGVQHPDLLFATYGKVKHPLPRSRLKASLAIAGDWAGQTSSDDIDATLYGGRTRRRS